MLKSNTRRDFIKKILFAVGALFSWPNPATGKAGERPETMEPACTVYRSIHGQPGGNITKVIELAGGMDRLLGAEDIVLIKPNVQWWNQGAPNLQALMSFVDLIFERPGGFSGEVVMAENCHRGPKPYQSMSSGWVAGFARNSDIQDVHNFNELAQALKRKFGDRFSTVHWVNVAVGGKRVFSPADGCGYVYCDGTGGVPKLSFGNGALGGDYRETIMTYPIFKTDRGTVVDYRNGVWENGGYDGNRLKVVNFAALNHHSTYCGFTSLIKNYLGVADLSGGPDPGNDGKLTGSFYNFHSFPFDKWAPGPQPGMLGAEIGVFLNTIRKADLHVVTAEWIGLADRTEPPVVRTRAVLASTDPVALDYHSAKYLLFPNSGIRFHDPDAPESPTHQYLKACADHGGGVFDERRVALVSYDHRAGRLQRADEAVVKGRKIWGSDPKAIGKYLLMRYGAFLL